jgi:hypothetical protein
MPIKHQSKGVGFVHAPSMSRRQVEPSLPSSPQALPSVKTATPSPSGKRSPGRQLLGGAGEGGAAASSGALPGTGADFAEFSVLSRTAGYEAAAAQRERKREAAQVRLLASLSRADRIRQEARQRERQAWWLTILRLPPRQRRLEAAFRDGRGFSSAVRTLKGHWRVALFVKVAKRKASGALLKRFLLDQVKTHGSLRVEGSFWNTMRLFRWRVVQMQRWVRAFLHIRAARLHAMGRAWERVRHEEQRAVLDAASARCALLRAERRRSVIAMERAQREAMGGGSSSDEGESAGGRRGRRRPRGGKAAAGRAAGGRPRSPAQQQRLSPVSSGRRAPAPGLSRLSPASSRGHSRAGSPMGSPMGSPRRSATELSRRLLADGQRIAALLTASERALAPAHAPAQQQLQEVQQRLEVGGGAAADDAAAADRAAVGGTAELERMKRRQAAYKHFVYEEAKREALVAMLRKRRLAFSERAFESFREKFATARHVPAELDVANVRAVLFPPQKSAAEEAAEARRARQQRLIVAQGGDEAELEGLLAPSTRKVNWESFSVGLYVPLLAAEGRAELFEAVVGAVVKSRLATWSAVEEEARRAKEDHRRQLLEDRRAARADANAAALDAWENRVQIAERYNSVEAEEARQRELAEQRGLLEEQREIRQAAQHARQEAAAALGRAEDGMGPVSRDPEAAAAMAAAAAGRTEHEEDAVAAVEAELAAAHDLCARRVLARAAVAKSKAQTAADALLDGTALAEDAATEAGVGGAVARLKELYQGHLNVPLLERARGLAERLRRRAALSAALGGLRELGARDPANVRSGVGAAAAVEAALRAGEGAEEQSEEGQAQAAVAAELRAALCRATVVAAAAFLAGAVCGERRRHADDLESLDAALEELRKEQTRHRLPLAAQDSLLDGVSLSERLWLEIGLSDPLGAMERREAGGREASAALEDNLRRAEALEEEEEVRAAAAPLLLPPLRCCCCC